ncbi:peptide-methionine (R)-S-oxide reductase MsrB [Microvirga sp. P5_D2]|jgi:peptide-methionine (R)-S-oxide reductase
MITRRVLVGGGVASLALAAGLLRRAPPALAGEGFGVAHTDTEWRKLLKPDQYSVLRQSGTEAPFSSPLLNEHRDGTFTCAGCQRDLFSSKTKFESGTGWPSFWAPLEKSVGLAEDTSYGMVRTSVHCSRCGGHLGHAFDDGPPPTGQRYCMNGVAMNFIPAA